MFDSGATEFSAGTAVFSSELSLSSESKLSDFVVLLPPSGDNELSASSGAMLFSDDKEVSVLSETLLFFADKELSVLSGVLLLSITEYGSLSGTDVVSVVLIILPSGEITGRSLLSLSDTITE